MTEPAPVASSPASQHVPLPEEATVYDLRELLPRYFSVRQQHDDVSAEIYDNFQRLHSGTEYEVIGTPVRTGIARSGPGSSSSSVANHPAVVDAVKRITAMIETHHRVRAVYFAHHGMSTIRMMSWNEEFPDPGRLMEFRIPIHVDGLPTVQFQLFYLADTTVVQRTGPRSREYGPLNLLGKRKGIPDDVVDRIREYSGMRTKGFVLSQRGGRTSRPARFRSSRARARTGRRPRGPRPRPRTRGWSMFAAFL